MRLELLDTFDLDRRLTLELPHPLLGGDQLLALSGQTLLRGSQQLVEVRAALVVGDLQGPARLDLLQPSVQVRVLHRGRLELRGEVLDPFLGGVRFDGRAAGRTLELRETRAFLGEGALGFPEGCPEPLELRSSGLAL